ncbi:MAG: gliding motility-associated C-terminal domain-containing protein, partial [Bacteroidales bacterium]|nr:gliding motility-associated C-terminal domain-containing protein [Bacteroidales bacterium]
CYQVGSTYIRETALPSDGWGPDDPIDTVIQIGGPNSQGTGSQSIEYWFRPSVDESVLLVDFAFAQEKAPHDTYYNPFFYIEVMDSNYNLLDLGYYQDLNGHEMNQPPYYWPYSRFLIVPVGTSSSGNIPYCLATPTGWDYYGTNAVNHTFMKYSCPYSQYGSHVSEPHSGVDCEWFAYTPVAFDLTKMAQQHKTVIFRVKSHACQASYHWAYGYFAAKMIPGFIAVDACGSDAITLSVPAGFNADTYLWYAGADSASATQKTAYAGMRNVVLNRNDGTRIYPYYRCYMQSMSGVPFIYEAHIKFYDLTPDFTYEQIYGSCDYTVQFSDSSLIMLRSPAAEVGGTEDTIYQTTQWIQWFKNENNNWTRFATNDLSPTTHFDAPGDYEIRIVIEDEEHVCSDTIVKVITIEPDAVGESTNVDTVYTCEENLPIIYDQATLGTEYTWHDAGTRRVTYPAASWNGCDSLVDVTLIVQKPQVEIAIGADFCDEFTTTLTAEANVNVAEYLWNTEETSPMIEVQEPGDYAVTITDESGCVAEKEVTIPACKPFVNLPNTITPSDHNGLNDYLWIPQKNLIQSLEFSVFNRNGELVYSTTNKDFQWDGRVNGKLFVNVTYNYILKVIDYDNYATMYKGSITVL